MDYQSIKKVHVVYKTHLDIGFTDMGGNVIRQYMEKHIPHSINLAMELNTPERKKFIWTLGSYLIDYCLKNASDPEKEKLEEAIRKGYICWHGLSCTTHSELLDKDLFRYGIQIGKRLDERFGRHTIAAKMTDVPGHTIAIVDELARAGIQFLHIGVNASSRVPQVPETFLWKHGDHEVIVQYSAQYGAPGYVEGMDEVLEFAHTGDNLGPQSAEDIQAEFDRLQKKYPQASVEASTLDDYARSVLKYRETLPVVEEEIGDTWIHGIASDPWKVIRYRALVQLKDKWEQEGRLREDCSFYDSFMTNLLLIAEHTWGLDFKKYLADFKNWTKEDFRKAREKDVTTLEDLTSRNAWLRLVLETDLEHYRGGQFSGSYRAYEASYQEQRAYLEKACEELPEDMKQEVREAFAALCPVEEKSEGEQIFPGQQVQIGPWRVAVGGNGAISHLEKDGRVWIKKGAAGLFQYEVFSAVECVNNYYRYNRDFRENGGWSEPDFSKPGLEAVEDLEYRCYDYGAAAIFLEGNRLVITLNGDTEAAERFGAPRKAQVVYDFGEDQIGCSLRWFKKDANKIPEALWFGFRFDVENPNRWMMRKMGTRVSPLNVVRGGNRLLHGVEALEYQGADGQIRIENLHSPLVSAGGRNMYRDYNEIPDLSRGFAFNLFNNKWGTNFSMWCEDECAFDYRITIKNS